MKYPYDIRRAATTTQIKPIAGFAKFTIPPKKKAANIASTTNVAE